MIRYKTISDVYLIKSSILILNFAATPCLGMELKHIGIWVRFMKLNAEAELRISHVVKIIAWRLAGHVAERVEGFRLVDLHALSVLLPVSAQHLHHDFRISERVLVLGGLLF